MASLTGPYDNKEKQIDLLVTSLVYSQQVYLISNLAENYSQFKVVNFIFSCSAFSVQVVKKFTLYEKSGFEQESYAALKH